MGRLYLIQIAGLSSEINKLDRRIAAAAKESDVARKLQTMPGIGPVCAMAIDTIAPDMREFAEHATSRPASGSFPGNIPAAES